MMAIHNHLKPTLYWNPVFIKKHILTLSELKSQDYTGAITIEYFYQLATSKNPSDGSNAPPIG